MTANSILRNTNSKVEITHIYPKVESGCTGFSRVRYDIKYGIYLDCDMIVLGDIAELWMYHTPGKFVCMADGSTEVAVIDCEHQCDSKWEDHLLPKLPIIPLEWSCEDHLLDGKEIPGGAKNIHYTRIKTQPWLHGKHPNPHLDALWRIYK